MVTPQELAARINGLEYGDRLAEDIINDAKAYGLVIVTGESDDLVEFEGAAYEEVGAYDGATIPLAKNGEPIFGCDEPCDHCSNISDGENAKYKIEAKRDDDNYAWFIDINLDADKYGAFDVLEDGEKFCRGIVFKIEDIQ